MSDTEPAAKHSPAGAANTWPMDCWYFAGLAHEFKAGNQARQMFLGEPVVIGRTATGELFALRDICPHRLVPLSAGRQLETNGEPTLECPYHGWRFGTDGVCRLLPSLTDDDPTDPSRIKVRNYPIHEAHGALYVFVSADPRFEGPPDIAPPDFGLSTSTPKRVGEAVLETPLDGAPAWFRDPSSDAPIPTHWTWHPLHDAGDLGEFTATELATVVMQDYGCVSVRSWRLRQLLGKPITIDSQLSAPGYRLDRVRGTRAELLTLACLVPETATRCRLTVSAWSDSASLSRLLLSAGELPSADKAAHAV